MSGTIKPPGGLHWRHIRQALTRVRAHTHTTTENTPDQWLVWNAGFVSSHSGHFHSRAVCESVVVFQFHICCQLIGTIMLCVGREYIGCHTITLLCLRWETSAAVTKCWSRQNTKIIQLIYCSYWIDVGNWVTIIMVGFRFTWQTSNYSQFRFFGLLFTIQLQSLYQFFISFARIRKTQLSSASSRNLWASDILLFMPGEVRFSSFLFVRERLLLDSVVFVSGTGKTVCKRASCF